MAELIGSRDAVRQRAQLGDGGGERFMTGMYRWFVADAGARERFGALLRRIADVLEVRREYLAAAFDEVQRRFGTFDRYVSEGLRLDAALRGALAEALVDGH